MKTFENKRIRVSVGEEIYQAYLARSRDNIERLRSGDVRVHGRHAEARGHILSDAMKKLANASDVALLTHDAREHHNPAEVRRLARESLIVQWLDENGRYNLPETLMRWIGGHRLNTGMAQDVENAMAYADGLLSPLNREDYAELVSVAIMSAIDAGESDWQIKRSVKKLLLRRGVECSPEAAAAIDGALHALDTMREADLRYRARFAEMDGWEIDVIGEMPRQIGLCRYDGFIEDRINF